jgi:hypothetical protein
MAQTNDADHDDVGVKRLRDWATVYIYTPWTGLYIVLYFETNEKRRSSQRSRMV